MGHRQSKTSFTRLTARARILHEVGISGSGQTISTPMYFQYVSSAMALTPLQPTVLSSSMSSTNLLTGASPETVAPLLFLNLRIRLGGRESYGTRLARQFVYSVYQLRQDFLVFGFCKCDTHKALDFSTLWFGTRRSMVQIHSPRPFLLEPVITDRLIAADRLVSDPGGLRFKSNRFRLRYFPFSHRLTLRLRDV